MTPDPATSRLTLWLGTLVSVMGAAVVLGWLLDVPPLVYLAPGLPATQAGAGLGFMAIGLATVSAATGAHLIRKVGAWVGVLLGVLTLGSFLGNLPSVTSFSSLVSPIADGMLQPRLMAPNTAISFVVAGGALLLPHPHDEERPWAILVALSGAALLLIGGLDVVFLLLERVGGLQLPAQMALPTAVAVTALGVALLAHLTEGRGLFEAGGPDRGALLVGIAAFALVLAAAQLMRVSQRTAVDRLTASRAELLRRDVSVVFREHGASLVAIAGAPIDDSVSAARVYAAVAPGHTDALGLVAVDAAGRPVWSVPGELRDAPLPSPDPPGPAGWGATAFDLPDGTAAVYLSAPAGWTSASGGHVAMLLAASRLVDEAVVEDGPLYGMRVRTDGRSLFQTAAMNQAARLYAQQVDLGIPGLDWRLQVWPTALGREVLRRPVPLVTLLVGLVLSVLLASSLRAGRLARRTAAELGRALTALREEEARRTDAQQRLEESQERLRRLAKMEALVRMASGLSHRFNNLLSVIQGRAELLAERLENDPVAVEDIEEIWESSGRGAELIQQLQAFTARRIVRAQKVDLGAELRAARGAIESIAGADVTVTVAEAVQPLPVEVEPTELHKVILKLVDNAREAMADGGTIRLSASEGEVGVDRAASLGLVPGCYGVLEVADTGPGIPGDQVSDIFDPFYSTKPSSLDAGLGLAFVDGFARQSGGAVAVESASSQGTTFALYLPLRPVQDAPRS